MLKVRLAVAAALITACTATHAQNYPTRAIRFIIPQSAGSATDTVARMIGQRLSEKFGQPVVHENRAGAGGVIGAELMVKSPPDGYTMLIISATHSVNPSLRKSMPYDSIADFAPVTLATAQPYVMLAHPSLPAKNVKELIALARAHPGQVNYASSGAGTLGHLGFEQLNTMGKVKMVHVPYKGIVPAMTDIVGGHVTLLYSTVVSGMPQVNAGKLRCLGATSRERSPLLPNVPTIAEQGIKDFESYNWNGVLAPAGTPAAVVNRIAEVVSKQLATPEAKALYSGQGHEASGIITTAYADFIKAETEKWAKIARVANIPKQ